MPKRMYPHDICFEWPNLACSVRIRLLAICVLLLPLSANSAAPQTGGASRKPAKAIVVELVVIARDNIPIGRPSGGPVDTGYPGLVKDNKLVLHPEAARRLRWNRPGRAMVFSKKIKELKDARYIFVERISYLGTGRRGTFTRIFLSRSFPGFPTFNPPDKVFIGPLADRGRLMRIVPWPRGRWRMAKNGVLEIDSKAGVKRLEAGEKFEFPERVVEIPMRFVRYKPVPVGSVSASAERQEIAAGKGRFSAKVVVVFHGALDIVVAK